jgi:predicted nucleotidyltransferase
MDKERILGIIRQHESEFKAAGVLHLRLFGSVVRGEATAESDVDILADLDNTYEHDLISVVRVQNRLSDLLETDVHLSLSNSLRATMLERIARESAPAF